MPQTKDTTHVISETNCCGTYADNPIEITEFNADKIIVGIRKYFK